MSIRVLVVDDSAFMRKLISEMINEQPDMEVVATARNGKDALEKLESLEVDIVTLDVEMPIMNGLETLERLMAVHPKPVILLSSVTERGSEITMKGLSLGAIDFVPKPSGSISLDLRKVSQELVDKVRAAVAARLLKAKPRQMPITKRSQPVPRTSSTDASKVVVVIGSSTGGPKAVEEVFSSIPANLRAGILVIQHMPKGFTRSFADRLNSLFPLQIKEAESGDVIQNGKVLIAPGDYHMTIDRNKQVRLNQDPPVQFLRPSIDVTMQSIPQVFSRYIVGVVLTGMGKDGAKGMAAIKKVGGLTIAQDRMTSTIYSMPRAVYEDGNADYVLPLGKIGDSIHRLVDTFY